jgi:hypothetical protein
MIVKFFTRGTGGSSGVFNYLLKDKEQEDGLRLDAEILRGDIDNQALLIDSLDFKQKYTSGCLSFTESADQVTEEQKEQLMDGFEETIRAGLGIDRVSVSWIEHRDKGRLELNFVYANVDLKHGRAFQPYVHSVDKRRVNAWKDMQNIEHGFTDPSDPANKRLMGQRDNLPRDIKDARQSITDVLKGLVEKGVVKSRGDVVQTLTDAGFEIARETDKAISIKNPNGKRNIRLTGGLYERNFNFNRELQETVERASDEHRAGATERYNAAKQLYDSEIERKRDYHQTRHGKPRLEQRAAARNVSQAPNRYEYSPANLFKQRPSPYHRTFRPVRRRHREDDRGLHTAYRPADRAARGQDSASYQVRNEGVGSMGRSSGNGYTGDGLAARGADSQQVLKTDRNQPIRQSSIQPTTTDQLRAAEVSNGQETARTGAEGATSTRGHDTAPKADARRQRSGYSRIDSLIEQASTSANSASATLTDIVRAVTEQDKRTDKRTKWLGESSEELRRDNENLDNRINDVMQRSNSANREHERVSECDSTARELKRQYGAVKGQIERFTESTDQTRDIANKNDQIADRNTRGIDGIKQIAEQVREMIQAKNLANTRSSSPRMGR